MITTGNHAFRRREMYAVFNSCETPVSYTHLDVYKRQDMQKENIRIVAFDLDGTLTQHKTHLEPFNRAVLDELARRYRLLMVRCV